MLNQIYKRQSIFSLLRGLFIVFSIVSIQTGASAQKQPNIIWLMAEDISTDLECYGMKAVKTPNLNLLAQNGIKFNNCFSTSPICSPNRSAMMTGVHQNKINAHNHRSNREIPLQEPYKPFTYFLRKAGYTCILGNADVFEKGRKIDVNFKSKPLGEWDGKEQFGLFDKYDEYTAADQPFFAQIQLKVTHRGDWWNDIRSGSKKPVDPQQVVLPPYLADHPAVRLDWAKYLDQIEYMDEEVGRLIQDLKNKGIYENTVIIFIGDNGRCNVRGKGYLFDSGLRVPLIMSWPDKIKAHQVREDIISTTDITAAILDLAEAETPDYLTGRSFLKPDFSREYVYSTRDYWDEILDKSKSLSSGRYKYIRNDMWWVPYDAHQVYLEFYRPAVHIMRKLKYENKLNDTQQVFFKSTKPKEQLYDLKSDPHELNNLAGNPQFQSTLNELRIKLSEIEKEMTSKDTRFEPVAAGSYEMLDWLKYTKPGVYQRMLEGEEVGFQKYIKLYNDEH